MKEPLGFDCDATLYGMGYDKRMGYGIPCQLAFNFCFFFKNSKGNTARTSIEPPHWDIIINKLNCVPGGSLGYTTPRPTEPPKQGFNYEKWKELGEKLSEMFYLPGIKESIEPGIDRYGYDFYVVFNPDRPPYWVPVTIREAFTLLIEFWKNHPDKIQSDMMLAVIEPEYEKYSESEKDGLAYSGGVGGIGSLESTPQIMRINKDYWNKKLPRSAIQFMKFNLPSKLEDIEREMNDRLKNGGGTYHIWRFQKELDINTITSVIDK